MEQKDSFYEYVFIQSFLYYTVVLDFVLNKFEVPITNQAYDVVWNSRGVRHRHPIKDSTMQTFLIELVCIRY